MCGELHRRLIWCLGIGRIEDVGIDLCQLEPAGPIDICGEQELADWLCCLLYCIQIDAPAEIWALIQVIHRSRILYVFIHPILRM